jgi:hypothetical protein
MVDFINEYTDINGISARIPEDDPGWHNVVIECPNPAVENGKKIIAQLNTQTAPQDNMNGTLYLTGGGYVNYGSYNFPTIGYATSHGLLFIVSPSSNQAMGLIFSKTNNDQYGGACQDSNGNPYGFGFAQAIGDKSGAAAGWTIAFPQHSGASNWANNANVRDQIQLVPIPTRGNGVISYFPHAFWIPWSPTREYGIVQIGDKKYAMSSYMALEE